MSRKQYPQDVTEDEADLGFRLIVVEKIANRGAQFYPDTAVVLILSESDILLKIALGIYSPRSFGRKAFSSGDISDLEPAATQMGWFPIAPPIYDPAMFLQECEAGIMDASVHRLEPAEFESWEISE